MPHSKLRPLASLVVAIVCSLAGFAHASLGQVGVEGALMSVGGAPAVDGEYSVQFSTYDAASGGAQLWGEGPVKLTVAGGRFSAALGASKTLDAKALAAAGTWLEVKVGSDPPLPRQPLRAVPFAVLAASAAGVSCNACVGGDVLSNGSVSAAKIGFNYAGSTVKGGPALDVDCTGCIGVGEIIFDDDVDLAGASLKAKNGTFSGDVVAKTVTAGALIGDGSKITGIKLPTGKCPSGQAVIGVNVDGTLTCAPAGLVPDGLNEVSNDLLSNQFVDEVAAKDKAVAIPDNTGAEALSNIEFPDIGVAQSLKVKINVSNSDLSTLSLVLLPPNDKKVGVTICDPCGDVDAKTLTLELPKTAPKSGDLGAWVGVNPKGTWTLKAKDVKFCVVQAPGNDKICDLTKKTDGAIVNWSIVIQTLSNKKVQMNGDFLVSGKVVSDNGTGVGTVPVSNAKSQPGLFSELSGNRWKQCTWKNLNNNDDSGDVVECPYVKKYDNTALRIVWDGTLRSAYNCNACCKRWYFTVNGSECAKPGQIEGVLYTHILQGSTTDLHHHHHIEGFCTENAAGPIKAGSLKIVFATANCAGYSDNDGYTGWNSTSRIIVEEVPVD